MEFAPTASRSISAPRQIAKARRQSVEVSQVKGSPELKIHIRQPSRSRDASSSESLSVSNSPIDESLYFKSPRGENVFFGPRSADAGSDLRSQKSPRRSRKSSSPAATEDNSAFDGGFLSPRSRNSSPWRKKRASSGHPGDASGSNEVSVSILATKTAEAPTSSTSIFSEFLSGIPQEIWIDLIPMLDLRTATRLSMASSFWSLYPWTFVTTVDLCPRRSSTDPEWGSSVKDKSHQSTTTHVPSKQKMCVTPLMYKLSKAQRVHPFMYRLKSLSVDLLRVATDEDCSSIYHLLPKFYNLTNLALLNIGVSKQAFSTEQFKDLSSLTALQSLDISGYVHLYRVLPLLADGQFPRLENLVLRNSVRKRATPEINDACLLIISKLTSLKSLHLTGFKKVTNVGASMLTTLQSLEELSIVDCPNLHRGVAVALKALTNLRTLELSHNAFSRSRESPLFVVSKMTKLTSFKHFASAKITDDVLYQLRHLVNLETLCVTAAPYLTAGGVEKLMAYVGCGLRKFHLRWCPTIKSLSFLKFLVNVEDLDLGGCYNLTDRDLKPIRKYCTKLQNFSIARLDKITENALTHIVLKLTTLESLSVSGCGFFSADSLKSLSTLPRLRRLNVSECPKLTGDLTSWKLSSFVSLFKRNSVHQAGTDRIKLVWDEPEPCELSDFLFKARLAVSGL